MYIPILLVIAGLAGLFYVLGNHIRTSRYGSYARHFPALLVGFVAYLAVFQIVALPFLATRANPRLFFGCIGIVTVVWFLIALYRTPLDPRKTLQFLRQKQDKVSIAFCILVILLAVLGVAAQRYDIDDSYYLGMAADSTVSTQLYAHDPSTGITGYPMFSFYALESYELLIATISFVSHIPVATVAHIILAPLFIILALLAYRSLFAYVLINKLSRIAAIIFGIVLCFTGSSLYLSGNFILSRSWQGKSLLIGIFVPLFLVTAIRFLSNNSAAAKTNVWPQLAAMWAIELAAFASSPVSIYVLPPFLLVAVIVVCAKKPLPNACILARRIGVVLAPIVLWALLLKITTLHSASQLDPSWFVTLDGAGWWATLFWFIGRPLTWLVVGICSAFLIAQRSLPRAHYLTIGLVGSFIVTVNPITANIIAQYITTSATYWRLLWVSMPEVIAACFGTWLLHALWNRTQIIQLGRVAGVFLTIVSVVLFGGLLFQTSNGFALATNVYKVPDSAVAASRLPNGSTILADQLTAAYVRAINPTIKVAYSRANYMAFNLAGEPNKLHDITSPFAVVNGQDVPDATFGQSLKRQGIDYIAYQHTNTALASYVTASHLFKQVSVNDDYAIQQVL